jgi:VanZ family protein
MVRKNLFSIIIALVILFLSLTGSDTFSRLDIPDIKGLDKIVHGAMYFALMLALIYENRKELIAPVSYLYLALIPIVFGIIVEMMQKVLTNKRSGEITDALFNLAGILFAILVWLIIKNSGKRTKS